MAQLLLVQGARKPFFGFGVLLTSFATFKHELGSLRLELASLLS